MQWGRGRIVNRDDALGPCSSVGQDSRTTVEEQSSARVLDIAAQQRSPHNITTLLPYHTSGTLCLLFQHPFERLVQALGSFNAPRPSFEPAEVDTILRSGLGGSPVREY